MRGIRRQFKRQKTNKYAVSTGFALLTNIEPHFARGWLGLGCSMTMLCLGSFFGCWSVGHDEGEECGREQDEQ